jgi:hypothetical protein
MPVILTRPEEWRRWLTAPVDRGAAAATPLAGRPSADRGGRECAKMRPEPAPNRPDEFDLRPRRVHEAEGRGRRAFALFQAVRHPGPLVWIVPSHVPELPMLRGLPRGVGERLHLFRPEGETDLLWCVEEACARRRSAWSSPNRKSPSR